MILSMLIFFGLSVPVAVAIGIAADPGASVGACPGCGGGAADLRGPGQIPLVSHSFFILARQPDGGRRGISERMVEFAKSLVGGIQGGLACTCVLTCMIFAAVAGSAVATTFAVGAILIDSGHVSCHGYLAPFAASLQASAAELGVIIPPSIPMILFAVSTDTSTGELFIAGVMPGVLIGLALMRVCMAVRAPQWPGQAGRRGPPAGVAGVQASLAGPADAGHHPGRHLRRRVHAHRGVGGRGHVRGADRLAGLPPPVVRPHFDHPASLGDLDRGHHVRDRQRGRLQLPAQPRRHPGRAGRIWLSQLFDNHFTFLMGVNAALFVIGMFIETSASVVVLAPLLLPVAMKFGVGPVHFGVIMVVNLALGMITPPFGVNLFAACAVAKLPLERLVRPLVPVRRRGGRVPAGHYLLARPVAGPARPGLWPLVPYAPRLRLGIGAGHPHINPTRPTAQTSVNF